MPNIALKPSRRTRAIVYIVTLVGTPFVFYLHAKGFIGQLEVNLWGAEITAAGTLALVNIDEPPAA